MCDFDSDVEFMNNIAPNVLGVLEKDRFFAHLDELFCPVDPLKESVRCGHSFDHSISILNDFGMDSDDVDDVLAVLKSRGACCDCEILYNVVEESRLKARYWKARATGLISKKSDPQPDN